MKATQKLHDIGEPLARQYHPRAPHQRHTDQIHALDQAPIPPPWHHLRALLLAIGRIEPIRGYDESYLSIHTPDILALIQRGDPSWEQMVPAAVAEIIKAENLFGWRPGRATSTTG